MMIDRDRSGQRDTLTGTVTAQAMRRFLEAALDLSEADGPSVALVAIGIDDLSRLSAEHGAAVADAVLLGVADRLHASLRAHDLVGRLGNGFCICLPEAFTSQARVAAERLHRSLQDRPVSTPLGPLALRCSLGLAAGRGPGSSAEELMARAESALALAQAAGGSRIVADH
ncbi:GGDEF domain-containing protein [Roseicella aquatilis]|nr:GGDEF domain-containing protein [Roseicella aquatilis]